MLLLSFRLCPSLRTHSLLHRNAALSQESQHTAGAQEFRATCELTTSWALCSPEQDVLLSVSVSINLTYKVSFFLWFTSTEIVTVTAASKWRVIDVFQFDPVFVNNTCLSLAVYYIDVDLT